MSRLHKTAAAFTATLILLAVSPPARGELEAVGVVEVLERQACVAASYDVSAVVAIGDLLVLGVDEGTALQLLALDEEEGAYLPRAPIELGSGDAAAPEIDVEGLAWDGDRLYVAGSHSARRKTVKEDRKRKKNRDRLATVEPAPSRDRLLRLRLDPTTGAQVGETEELELRGAFLADPYLRPFAGLAGDDDADPPRPALPPIPSKDNGIDIEGLAVAGDRLYLGFRGPVLRGGHVPVMVLGTDWPAPDPQTGERPAPQSWQLRFVRFGGRGIRSLAAAGDGFLAVAGPVGDSELSYRLYYWDGEDCVGGKDVDGPACTVLDLGEIPTWAGAKAEGLEVLDDQGSRWRVLIAYDSAPLGLPTLFELARPGG